MSLTTLKITSIYNVPFTFSGDGNKLEHYINRYKNVLIHLTKPYVFISHSSKSGRLNRIMCQFKLEFYPLIK